MTPRWALCNVVFIACDVGSTVFDGFGKSHNREGNPIVSLHVVLLQSWSKGGGQRPGAHLLRIITLHQFSMK